MQQTPAPRRWSASHALVALIIVAAGGYWVAQTLRPGSVIDQETLDAETLRVLNAADGRPVPGRIVLQPSGDEIVFTPVAPLEPGTRYRLHLEGAKDTQGTEMIPFTMSFTTSAD